VELAQARRLSFPAGGSWNELPKLAPSNLPRFLAQSEARNSKIEMAALILWIGDMDIKAKQILNPPAISRNCTRLSQWVSLETISVAHAGSGVEIYHAFRQADYVQVLPMTPDALFVLVRQYRPVIECWTLELPGGLRDSGEKAETAAIRELREEAGLAVIELVPLIECDADVGRLCNRFFGYFALVDQVAEPESGITNVFLKGDELRSEASAGQLGSPTHVALLYLAATNARVREICRRHGETTIPWL
jgi:ADP-ribose pyrophosphatase